MGIVLNIGFILIMVFWASCGWSKQQRLSEYEVFHVNSPYSIEPSGLVLKGDELFTVCDDSNYIYKLNFLDQTTVAAVVDQVLDLGDLSTMNLDLEGITVVGEDFFVASEVHHKLVNVKANSSSWAPELGSVYPAAYEQGLFQKYNAGIEAVTYLGAQTFLMAVEREPRGLIEVTFDPEFKQIIKQTNQIMNSSDHLNTASRSADFAGLYKFGDTIYALHRNAYVIHELYKNAQGEYLEGDSWSYEHIVRDPDFVYQKMDFGHAEGLAIDNEYFYLILDNNAIPSAKNINDKRPLLIKAKRN